MRIWDIAPARLCRNHLLGEHNELHAIWSIIAKRKRGYSRHPEVLRWKGKLKALYGRHEKLIREMARRGYIHKSLLPIGQAKGSARQNIYVTPYREQLKLLRKKGCDCRLDDKRHSHMKAREELEKNMDPEVAGYLKAVRSRPPAHTLSIKELRRDIDKLRDFYGPEAVKKIEDRQIPGPNGKIPIRIYTPEGRGPFPLVVFYHGGGWCIGSIKGYDSFCAALTNRISAVFVSVGYRLAPENPFPAAVDDCYAALLYAAKNTACFNACPERLIVMGDSAGGNLAAAMCVKSKREGSPRINFQVLIYPATNILRLETGSFRLFGEGYDLDRKMIEVFRANYTPDEKDRANPYASPALAKGLKGVPDALIITAEFDPLRGDGMEYARLLKKAGVRVKHSLYKGVIHGFMSFTTFHAAQKAFDEIAATIRSS